MKRLPALAAGLLSALCVAPVSAQQPPALDDFVALCPPAVLAPDSFSERLAESGYREDRSIKEGGWIATNYTDADGGETLQVIVQDFSDATSRTCILVSGTASTDKAWIETVQQLLADEVGVLEGKVIAEGNFTIGNYKAEGVDPLITVNIVAAEGLINLTLNAWTFSP
jgi:hypothetical protein